jgi:hypothetical protein
VSRVTAGLLPFMNPGRALLRPALAAALLALPGCRDEAAAPTPVPAAPAPAPSASTRPVDQVVPGELAEGADNAFGLRIPRRLVVKARFPEAVFATGKVAPERVANYVRERVAAERVETGPVKTVFSKATLKNGTSKGPMRIEVSHVGGVTQLLVRDETRAPAKPGLTEEERWRELGLTPKGELLNPKRTE